MRIFAILNCTQFRKWQIIWNSNKTADWIQKRNMVSNLSSGKWFFSSEVYLSGLWSPLRLTFSRYQEFFSRGVKWPGGEVDYSRPPWTEVKGAIHPVHYTPSWNAQWQLYFYFASVFTVCTTEWAGTDMLVVFYSKVRDIKIAVNLIY